MTIFVLIVLLVAVGTIYAAVWMWRDGELVIGVLALVMGPLVGALLLVVIGVPLVASTTGAVPNYSVGTRDGYLTKVSREGVIWKTWECEVQVGAGEQAALQAPHAFSIRDAAVVESATALRSQRVRITYRRWLVQPWRYGATDYEVLKIEPLAKKPVEVQE